MDDLYVIELEPEVRSWLELLPGNHHRKVEEYAELLATLGPRTPMPGPAHDTYSPGEKGETR